MPDDWNKKAVYRRMKGYLYDFLPSEPVASETLYDQILHMDQTGVVRESVLPQAEGPLMREPVAEASAQAQKISPATAEL